MPSYTLESIKKDPDAHISLGSHQIEESIKKYKIKLQKNNSPSSFPLQDYLFPGMLLKHHLDLQTSADKVFTLPKGTIILEPDKESGSSETYTVNEDQLIIHRPKGYSEAIFIPAGTQLVDNEQYHSVLEQLKKIEKEGIAPLTTLADNRVTDLLPIIENHLAENHLAENHLAENHLATPCDCCAAWKIQGAIQSEKKSPSKVSGTLFASTANVGDLDHNHAHHHSAEDTDVTYNSHASL